jgi:antitoxin ChpS
MRTARLRTSGGSIIVSIPKPFLDQLGLNPDAPVEISIEDDKITICRRKRGRIGLAARLAMCDFSKPRSKDEQDWLDMPSAGRERIR